ncbi:hypothetical protein [Arenimonas caeni]|uniref:hypothetical protein n=1 Tax=Arenimonas caeni TaxID=2058085 RepID=UPI0013B063DC|nr:hypothetical protein [Arenimonas caeni]
MKIDQKKVERQDVDLVFNGDRFTGLQRISPNKAKPIGGTGMFTTVTWNTVFARDEKGATSYYVRIIYEGYGWLFLTGEVILLIDGTERVILQGPSSEAQREVLACGSPAGCKVQEGLRVPVEEPVVSRLARAQSVEVRLNGRSQYVQGHLKPYHQAGIRTLQAHIAESVAR